MNDVDERGEVPSAWRHRPLRTGFSAAVGVACGYALLLAVRRLEQVFVLVAISLLLAVGLDLPVGWLVRRGVRRFRAVVAVLVSLTLVGFGMLVALVTPLIAQTRALMKRLPGYVRELQRHEGALGHLEERLHLQQLVTEFTHHASKGGSVAASGLVGVGETVLSGVGATVLVVLLTCYLLAGLPRLRRMFYRLIPATRRERAELLGDEIIRRIGGYVLGNIITSLVAGVGTLLWLVAFRVPDPLALAVLVAVFDLVPVVGSTVAGAVVTLVALTVSLTTGVATLAFYLVYRVLEDYLLVPRVMRRTVSVSPLLTVLALILGASLLGILGALLAVPVAAAVQLVVTEVAVPRQDRS